MNIKYILSEYPDIDRLRKEYTLELNSLNESIITLNGHKSTDNIRATVITDMPHGSGVGDPTSAPIMATITSIEKRMNEISLEIKRLLDNKSIISEALKVLSNKEREIIELMYFQKLPQWQVRNKLNLQESTMWRIHNNALNKIEEGIKQNKTA